MRVISPLLKFTTAPDARNISDQLRAVVPRAAPSFDIGFAAVVNPGDVPNTKTPVPVSSDITPANCAEVVAAKTERSFATYATVPPAPNATELPSVPVRVRVFETVSFLPPETLTAA